jgi:hypothetical protein
LHGKNLRGFSHKRRRRVKRGTQDTGEEKIRQNPSHKQAIIAATLEKEGEFMQALFWNDVQELLSLIHDSSFDT